MTTLAKKVQLSVILVVCIILSLPAFIQLGDLWLLAQAAWHFASFCVWPLGVLLSLVVLYWCLEDEIEDFIYRRDARLLDRAVNRRRRTFDYTSTASTIKTANLSRLAPPTHTGR